MLTFVGEFVAQFKFTLLLMANGPMKITGLPFDETHYKSEYNIQDEEVKVTCCRSPYFVLFTDFSYEPLVFCPYDLQQK